MSSQSANSSRKPRLAKPSMAQLAEGGRFRFLQQALEETQGEEIVVIPPDGSDVEEMDGDEAAPPFPNDVPGFLEIFTDIEEDDVQPRQWRSHHGLIPIPVGNPVRPLSQTHPMLADKSAKEMFLLYFTPEIAEHICEETVRYARQCGDFTFTTTLDEMYRFIAFLLWTGYVILPRQRLYWDLQDDCSFPFPERLIGRDRFGLMKRYLHVDDNLSMDTKANKFAKVQYLFDALNRNLLQFGIFETNLSVDEQMVSYTGRHPQKQYMKAKPVKWGFKNFIMSSSTGYPLHVIPYQGRDSRNRKGSLCTEVVMKMAAILKNNSDINSHCMYMDNFYSSWRVFTMLHNIGLRATGTVRANRINKCPLVSDKDIPQRGDFDWKHDDKVMFVKWNDKAKVIMGTNFDTIQPLRRVDRWSKEGLASVTAPNCIASYNAYMGELI